MAGLPKGVVTAGSKLRQRTWVCNCKRSTTKVVQIGAVDTPVFTHKGCVCNEVAALEARHQLAAPPMLPIRKQELNDIADNITRDITSQGELEPVSYKEVISAYSGPKRKAYERALESLLVDPVTQDDAKCRMFIKADKYTEEAKAPRAIQYCTKRYGLALTRFTRPIEHAYYARLDWTGTRVVAKGRNQKQRAQDLVDKASLFNSPVFIQLDHSKFDSHVTVDLLDVEFRFYCSLFNGHNRRKLRRLLRWQRKVQGMTKNGTVYTTPGTRMSGVPNTGLGNSFLNECILSRWLRGFKHSLYLDGDDSVAIIEARDRDLLPNMQAMMESMCMETKRVDSTALEETEFCQSRPVETGEGWIMVRNPTRVLERVGWVIGAYPKSYLERWVKSVGLCELACNRGVPVLQELAVKLILCGRGRYLVTDRHIAAKALQHSVERTKPTEVTMSARFSFERAWGLTVAEQLKLEQMSVAMCSDAMASKLAFEQLGGEHPCDRVMVM